jgi:hypothetical protein
MIIKGDENMEYNDKERSIIIGKALKFAQDGQGKSLRELMNVHFDIFKDITFKIVTGSVSYDYQVLDMIMELL